MTNETIVECAGDGVRREEGREKGSDRYVQAIECCDRVLEHLDASIEAIERLERLLLGVRS